MSYANADPGIAPPGTAGVYVDSKGNAINPDVGRHVVPMAACTPVSGRDNPHRSTSDGPTSVSGHGWWGKGTCTHATATVYNCLYEYYTDGTWRRKACSTKQSLPPGSGRGNRTTARRGCNDYSLTSWRKIVDVDVNGQSDTAEEPMNQANVTCRVTGADA